MIVMKRAPRIYQVHRRPAPLCQRHIFRKYVTAVVVLAIIYLAGSYGFSKISASAVKPAAKSQTTSRAASATLLSKKPQIHTATAPNACASNTLSKNVIVSINQRQLWACAGAQKMYGSAVITGIATLPADLTPTGTYHIYAKQTDLNLKGSDSTGSWNDPVSYWMPFLDNQYGAYGFHDATWRNPSQFGQISPDSSNGSHGCVELPLATAKWLYGWTSVGTTVTIES